MPDRRTREELLAALELAQERCAELEEMREHPMLDPGTILTPLIESLGRCIFWKDRDSRYWGGNHAFARVAGCDSAEALRGLTDYDLAWKAEEADFFRSIDRRVMESGERDLNIEEPQLQKDGRQAWIRTSKVPVRNKAGEVIGILGHYEDITEERELLESRAEDREKLEQQSAENRKQMRIIDEQQAEIETLSTPVMEIWDDVLVLPLIGVLDQKRAVQFTSSLLKAIEQRGARFVIIDITGAAGFDRSVAQRIENGIHATGLLGAECFITGVSPQIAQQLSEQGIDLSGASISRSLKSALQLIVSRGQV